MSECNGIDRLLADSSIRLLSSHLAHNQTSDMSFRSTTPLYPGPANRFARS